MTEMTSKLAFTLLASFLVTPALTAQDAKTILSTAEIKRLQSLVQDWFEPWHQSRELPAGDRNIRKLQKKADDAREKVLKDWEVKSRKGDLLGSMPDLRAIFADPFSYARSSGSGNLKGVREVAEMPGHAVFIPRSYKSDADAARAVVVLPGTNATDKWQGSREYFADTWEGSAFLGDTLFVVNEFPEGMDLDPLPDYSLPNGDSVELSRIRQVFAPVGFELKPLHYDHDRLFLDCGRGASGFGLRFTSYFPLFAGVVLRHPIEISDEVRLGSLMGVPFLLVSSPATKQACDALARRLNELDPGKCTVIEGKDAYPFKESQIEIEAWMASQLRVINRPKVVIEPNSDRFQKVHWARILTADPLFGTPTDKRPRLVVEADRATNRIKVVARGVSQFQLYLNDDLIDLSKEFTVDINGTLSTQEQARNFGFMTEQMMESFDRSWIFTSTFQALVPKEEK